MVGLLQNICSTIYVALCQTIHKSSNLVSASQMQTLEEVNAFVNYQYNVHVEIDHLRPKT